MIDLAIALALEQANFGIYGETIFWNESPILSTGTIKNDEGMWVNAAPQKFAGDQYTDVVTISTRFADPLEQSEDMLKILYWLNGDFHKTCSLSLEPIVHGFEFNHVNIGFPESVSLDGADDEGRWVKSVQFHIDYKFPNPLPIME